MQKRGRIRGGNVTGVASNLHICRQRKGTAFLCITADLRCLPAKTSLGLVRICRSCVYTHTDISGDEMRETVGSTPRSNRRPRRLRFSLRSAMLCIFFAAIVLGLIAARVESGRDQAAAVRAILGMGGSVHYDSEPSTAPNTLDRWARQALGDDFFDNVTEVRFQGAHSKTWTQDEFREFGPDATPGQLSLWEPWTHKNVITLKTHLGNLTRLESLSFDRTVIPRHGLEAVSELHNLRYLDLEQTQITSVDLRYLSSLENLEALRLRRTRIRDDGLAHLNGLTRLKSLHLGSTMIGNDGLEHVAELTSLETLNLENTHVTDGGISHLRGLPNLRSLHLGLTKVSDASIDHVTCLVQLKTLVVGDEVTKEGIALLKRLLPSCDIQWSSYRGISASRALK